MSRKNPSIKTISLKAPTGYKNSMRNGKEVNPGTKKILIRIIHIQERDIEQAII
jgi:hypothetical protein